MVRVKDALQLLIDCYGYIRFAHVHEQVSTQSFVVLIIGNSKSNHFGARAPLTLTHLPEKCLSSRGGVTA